MKFIRTKNRTHSYHELLMIIMGILLFVTLIVNPYPKNSVVVPDEIQPVRVNQVFTPDTTPLPEENVANLVSKIETKSPVVFLTMDDGMVSNQQVANFIKRRGWPVSLFLADVYAKDKYDYFQQIVDDGAIAQNHTLTHPYLSELTFPEQVQEICGASDKLVEVFGVRPSLLRPPGGHYNLATLKAAKQCDIKAVVMWSAKVDDGQVQFQKGDRLVPGDIVLMHFRPKVMEDLAAFEAEIISQDLYVARLEDWLGIED